MREAIDAAAITDELRELRDQLRATLGQFYAFDMRGYHRLVKSYADRVGTNPLTAALGLASLAIDDGRTVGARAFLAAGVDMEEGIDLSGAVEAN